METKADLEFLLKTLSGWDLEGKRSADVYDDYKKACKKAKVTPIEKHAFSKQVCSMFNYRTQNKYVAQYKEVARCFCR